MKKVTNIRLTVMFVALLVLPQICLANNGLKALGAFFEMLFIILGVITAISLALMIGNITWKKTWIRVVNVLAFGPQVLFTLGAFGFDDSHVIGVLCVAFIGLQIYLLSKSFK